MIVVIHLWWEYKHFGLFCKTKKKAKKSQKQSQYNNNNHLTWMTIQSQVFFFILFFHYYTTMLLKQWIYKRFGNVFYIGNNSFFIWEYKWQKAIKQIKDNNQRVWKHITTLFQTSNPNYFLWDEIVWTNKQKKIFEITDELVIIKDHQNFDTNKMKRIFSWQKKWQKKDAYHV